MTKPRCGKNAEVRHKLGGGGPGAMGGTGVPRILVLYWVPNGFGREIPPRGCIESSPSGAYMVVKDSTSLFNKLVTAEVAPREVKSSTKESLSKRFISWTGCSAVGSGASTKLVGKSDACIWLDSK